MPWHAACFATCHHIHKSNLREENHAMPSGTEFIKHEFDEAIAIQRSIVESGTKLATSHPVAGVKRQMKSDLKVDQRHLTERCQRDAARARSRAEDDGVDRRRRWRDGRAL